VKNVTRAVRGTTALGLLGLMFLIGTPATVQAQSLADAMATAYKTSPRLAVARSDVKVFSERAVQARSFGRLQVEGQMSFEALLLDDARKNLRYPTIMALNAVQPLYTGGQVENSTEAAEKRITAREALLLATEQEVLLDAVTAFLDVRRDEELVEITKNNVRVLSEQLRAANERFEVGEVTRTDVEQARSRLAAAHSRQAAVLGSLAASRESYLQAVGELPGKLQPPPPLPDLPSSQDEAVSMALRDDPTVIATRIERDATSSDVRAAIGALLPQVSLRGSLSSDEIYRDGISGDEAASVGVFVTIPLYTGGFNYSNVREAQAVAEGASSDITDAMRAAARNVGVAWAELAVARASISAGQLEVSAAQLAFEGVREEAKLGARTTLDVLDAEQEVLNASGRLVDSRRDEYAAAYTLLAAVGKLTVEHLGLNVGDAPSGQGYYETVRDRNFGYDASDDTVWRHSLRP